MFNQDNISSIDPSESIDRFISFSQYADIGIDEKFSPLRPFTFIPKETENNNFLEKSKEDDSFKLFSLENTKNSKKPSLYLNKINNEIFKKEKKPCGRTKKGNKERRSHNKFSEDNIIRKIKGKFKIYIIVLLNSSLINKDLKFYKLNTNINENIKRDYNIKLFDTKIKDIVIDNNSLFKDKKDINKILVEKIIREGKEIEVIKLLNLTYLELFQVFRKKIVKISDELENKIKDITALQNPEFNNIYKIFEFIYEQEKYKNEEEDIKLYIEKFKDLCENYETWFYCKKGRKRNKNN